MMPEKTISLAEATSLLDELWLAKKSVEEAEEVSEARKKVYRELKDRVLSVLDAACIERLEGTACKVTRVERTSVKVPAEQDARDQFFSYLKDRGLYDSLITVNSQTLNAMYRRECEAAFERGELAPEIPGLAEPTIYYDLQVRAKN